MMGNRLSGTDARLPAGGRRRDCILNRSRFFRAYLPMNHSQVENQVAKIVSAWALIGVTSWAEAASFAAFLYTFLLICEWCWKKVGKPVLIRLGCVAAPAKDVGDARAE